MCSMSLGTKQMLDILEDIVSGEGKMEDIDLLEEMGKGLKRIPVWTGADSSKPGSYNYKVFQR